MRFTKHISRLVQPAALLFSAAVLSASFPKLTPLQSAPLPASADALYLPSGAGLELISFGYRGAFSHLLWFNTINYFGKHYRGNKDYRYLAHMCDLVTRLNPRADYAYRFCGMMLAWEGNEPQQAIAVFDRALEHFPESWLFYYLRGMLKAYFLSDDQGAKDDFIKASRLPGASPIIVRLASKQMVATGASEEALQFLEEAARSAPDEQSRKVLRERMLDVRHDLNFRELESAVEKFTINEGRVPQSLQELAPAYVRPEAAARGFPDPFGGNYALESGKVVSTSDRKRLSIKWNRHKSALEPANENGGF